MGSRSKIVVVVVLLLFALYSNLRLIHKEIGHLYRANHTVDINRARSFDALKKILPAGGIVGYVSGRNPPDDEANRDYFLAQYALCPLVLARDAIAPYVIADCGHRTDGNCFVGSGFVIVQEFDGGIRLYRQKER
jgi:hypothetical protein